MASVTSVWGGGGDLRRGEILPALRPLFGPQSAHFWGYLGLAHWPGSRGLLTSEGAALCGVEISVAEVHRAVVIERP